MLSLITAGFHCLFLLVTVCSRTSQDSNFSPFIHYVIDAELGEELFQPEMQRQKRNMLTFDLPALEYTVDIEVSLMDSSFREPIKEYFKKLHLPVSTNISNVEMTVSNINITTVCLPGGENKSCCSCESGYAWPSTECSDLITCPSVSLAADPPCGYVKEMPFYGPYCEPQTEESCGMGEPTVMNMSVRLDKGFQDDLKNSSSELYKRYKADLEKAFNASYRCLPGFVSATVTGFRPGSIYVNYEVKAEAASFNQIASSNRFVLQFLNPSYRLIRDTFTETKTNQTNFIVSPADISEGDTIRLTCEVNSTSDEVIWYHFDRIILNSSQCLIQRKASRRASESILQMKNITVKHSGPYTCTFRNRHSSLTRIYKATKTVKVSPLYVTPNLNDINVTCNSPEMQTNSPVLSCCIDRLLPSLTVDWKVNGAINITGVPSFSNYCTEYKLNIDESLCPPEKSGTVMTYTCEMQTGHGARRSQNIRVTYLRTAHVTISSSINSSVSEGYAFNITCESDVSNYDSISWKIQSGNNTKTVDCDTCIKNSKFPATSVLTVKTATKDWSGTYICTFSQKYLESSANVTVEVVALPLKQNILIDPIVASVQYRVPQTLACCISANTVEDYAVTFVVQQNQFQVEKKRKGNLSCYTYNYTETEYCENKELTAYCKFTNRIGQEVDSEIIRLHLITACVTKLCLLFRNVVMRLPACTNHLARTEDRDASGISHLAQEVRVWDIKPTPNTRMTTTSMRCCRDLGRPSFQSALQKMLDKEVSCSDSFGIGKEENKLIKPCLQLNTPNGFTRGNKIYRCSAKSWKVERNNCLSVPINNLLISAESLINSPEAKANLPDYLAELKEQTGKEQNTINSSPANLDAIISILDIVSSIPADAKELTIQNFLSTVDFIVADSTSEAWEDLNKEKILKSSLLLHSVENFSLRLQPINNSIPPVSANTLQLQGIVVTKNSNINYNKNFRSTENLTVSVFIDENEVQTLTQNSTIVSVMYSKLGGILPRNGPEYVNGLLITTTVSSNRSQKFDINMTFAKKNSSLKTPQCVFWNFTLNSHSGGWDTRGCTPTEVEGYVICSCNHLTSFSILMSPDTSSQLMLEDYITYTGLSISILSLVACIIIESLVWKYVTNNTTSYMRHVCILNIAISLLIADLWFLVTASINDQNQQMSKLICFVATFFIHFFYLCVFFWMLSLGLILFYRLVFILHNTSKTIQKAVAFCLGYGCPFVIAVITIAVTLPRNNYTRKDVCWLNWKDSKALLAFVIPALIIVATNLFITAVVIIKILRPTIGDRSNRQERNSLFQIGKSVAILTPLLGLTWGLGLATVIRNSHRVFHILFALLNALQGLFILVFGTLWDKKIQEALLKRNSMSKWSSQQTKSSSLILVTPMLAVSYPFARTFNNLCGKTGKYTVSSSEPSSTSSENISKSYSLLN